MDREKLRLQLMKHEGVKLFPYIDTVGKITIGVGRNLTDRGISSTVAFDMLDDDIDRCIHELSSFDWFLGLNDVRKRAMIDMVFNLGLTRFLGFRKLIAAMSVSDFDEAAHQMIDSDWATQVGMRANTLANMVKNGY